ncbi:MAG: C4-dicarboxylate transporter substrate-binding protein [Betaproteobacteria bacterium]|nr:C4-dicarboxylate transporter substrate-binding protein [Betaproteobacteria bacterium]
MSQADAPRARRKISAFGRSLEIPQVSWRDLVVAVLPVVFITAFAIWLALHFVRPAPPTTIIITSGPEGSSYNAAAEKYRKTLAANGVNLQILPSAGALENLNRLRDPNVKVDIGFVQGGLLVDGDAGDLMSLGSVFYAPLVVFYRAPAPLGRLSDFKGKRIAIGREGSGAHYLNLQLLKANGIDARGSGRLLTLTGADAAQALLSRKIDAAMLMGDAASPEILRKLVHSPGIRLMDFTQAEAYSRRYRYLSRLELPMGSIDFARNKPAQTLSLIAPTVELVARPDLHPALSDLLIEAAREAHGKPTLLQRAGEFPAPLEHEYPISDDAARYYKSGKGFLYRHMPFWIASLLDRTVVVLVPIIVLLIPGIKLVPAIYRWRVNMRIYKRYGELMGLERDLRADLTPPERAELGKRLDEIEARVNTSKMPLPYADQFYVLREHINFVRRRLAATGGEPTA